VTDDGRMLQDVSNAVVQVYKEQFGRGPTKARTSWAGPNALLCLLEDTLTGAEARLVTMGQHQRMREARMFLQHAAERDFCGKVEAITGRRVIAFMSGMDAEHDVSCEVFVLAPEAG
jgi:uncharacterized protein YbcI